VAKVAVDAAVKVAPADVEPVDAAVKPVDVAVKRADAADVVKAAGAVKGAGAADAAVKVAGVAAKAAKVAGGRSDHDLPSHLAGRKTLSSHRSDHCDGFFSGLSLWRGG
jgi:hypothetical protein